MTFNFCLGVNCMKYNALAVNVSSENSVEMTSEELDKVAGGVNKRTLGAAGAALMTMLTPFSNAFAASTNTNGQDTPATVSNVITKEKSKPKIIRIPKTEWMIAKRSNNDGKVIWYRGQKSLDSDKVKYYKTKNDIIGDPFKAFDEQGDSLFVEVTDESEIKDVQKIDVSLRMAADRSLQQFKKRYEEALAFKLKTMDEFKKLSKDEKIKYLTYRDSEVTKKMLCHPNYPQVFTSKGTGYYANFDKRASEYFKNLKGVSKKDLQKPEYKDLYREYVNCRDCRYYLNKFAEDSEIEAIYQITLDVLKEIFEENTI